MERESSPIWLVACEGGYGTSDNCGCTVIQGAKNHGVVMPDANKEHTINQVSGHGWVVMVVSHGLLLLGSQLVGAAFGAAGQRCMALTTAVFVGEAKEWIPEIVEKAKQLKVNAGVLFLPYSRTTWRSISQVCVCSSG